MISPMVSARFAMNSPGERRRSLCAAGGGQHHGWLPGGLQRPRGAGGSTAEVGAGDEQTAEGGVE